MKFSKSTVVFLAACAIASAALAQTPAPKAKAPDESAEAPKAAPAAADAAAKAKAAFKGKMDAYNLCKAQDKAVSNYRKTAAGKAKPPAASAPCTKPTM